MKIKLCEQYGLLVVIHPAEDNFSLTGNLVFQNEMEMKNQIIKKKKGRIILSKLLGRGPLASMIHMM